VLCASEIDVDAEVNAEFFALLSKPGRSKEEDRRLYTLAKEIIIVAGLDANEIHPIDRLRVASALIAVQRQS